MVRVLGRVTAGVVLALVVGLLTHAGPAGAVTGFVATGHSPTQGTPVPGGYLTADLGTWSPGEPDPGSYQFQWLRDGVPIDGATTRDYLVQVADIGHQLAPLVTAHSGPDSAHFVGTAMTARQIRSRLHLQVRRVHPRPGRARLVWMALATMHTERPWTTDGGSVTAFRRKHHHWKPLGSAVVARGAAFVRLPWKRAPHRRAEVKVCYLGSDAVAVSCSKPVVLHRPG